MDTATSDGEPSASPNTEGTASPTSATKMTAVKLDTAKGEPTPSTSSNTEGTASPTSATERTVEASESNALRLRSPRCMRLGWQWTMRWLCWCWCGCLHFVVIWWNPVRQSENSITVLVFVIPWALRTE